MSLLSATLRRFRAGTRTVALVFVISFLAASSAAQTTRELRSQAHTLLLEAREAAKAMKAEQIYGSSTVENLASGLVGTGDVAAALETLAMIPHAQPNPIPMLHMNAPVNSWAAS